MNRSRANLGEARGGEDACPFARVCERHVRERWLVKVRDHFTPEGPLSQTVLALELAVRVWESAVRAQETAIPVLTSSNCADVPFLAFLIGVIPYRGHSVRDSSDANKGAQTLRIIA